jgi:hypothetical protein
MQEHQKGVKDFIAYGYVGNSKEITGRHSFLGTTLMSKWIVEPVRICSEIIVYL